MYKRPARILFVSCADSATEFPCELLRGRMSDYLQGRCVALGQSAAMAEAMQWADLVIALDESVCRHLRAADANRPLQCWPLPAGEAGRRDFVREKLHSMVAGMRMMQRLDG